MKVLYVRVSTIDQKTDRQKNDQKEFDLVIEDKCSGSTPFFNREGGKKILMLIEKGMVDSISCHSIDRCGRDLLDILSVIRFMNEKLIPMIFIQQGLRTIDDKGKENAVSKMMISILGTVAEMERSRIRENQREGIELAKLRGVYKGRRKGAKSDIQKWIQKPKIAKTIEYLKKGYKANEISKIVGIHVNTITKVKKLMLIVFCSLGIGSSAQNTYSIYKDTLGLPNISLISNGYETFATVWRQTGDSIPLYTKDHLIHLASIGEDTTGLSKIHFVDIVVEDSLVDHVD